MPPSCSATSTATPSPTCPANNGTSYTVPNSNSTFTVTCRTDYNIGNSDITSYSLQTIPTYRQCINSCVSWNQNNPTLARCVAIFYGGRCFLKSAANQPATGANGDGAILQANSTGT
ncbi:MAG: hypothetical protein M1817_000350 [Caeruleum heppii]|nr:MAG: hypothetical protein M1817_000350 [Caeruleum heppii]